MSEKKMITICIFTILLLATLLVFLMLKNDIKKGEERKQFFQIKNEEITSWPKVEIETRK